MEYTSYTTKNEMTFLKGLGSWASKGHIATRNSSREDLLRTYIEVADLRVNWDGVDKETCVKYAESLLATQKFIKELNSQSNR